MSNENTVPSATPMNSLRQYPLMEYRHPSFITALLCILLMMGIFAEIMNISSSIFACTVLKKIKNNVYETQEEIQHNSNLSDVLGALAGLGIMIVTVVGSIVFLFWTYRFVKNAHCLSVRPLRFGPGWACGYYFIPILNLFRPYQALADAYRAVIQPNNWKRARASALIEWWWGILIISGIIGQATFRFDIMIHRGGAPKIDALLLGHTFHIVDGIVSILLAILTLLLVRKLYKAQTDTYKYVMENPQILENELAFPKKDDPFPGF